MPDHLARPAWLPPDDMPASGYLGDYLGFWAILALLAAGTAFYVYRVRFRGAQGGRAARVVGACLVALTTLWACVVVGETYLRHGYDATDSYGLTVTNRAWFRRHVHENAIHFREREFPQGPAAPGVARVVFVGDSFTYGYGVKNAADRFPDRVGAALARREPGRSEVWNAGKIGWETGDEARAIRHLTAELNPSRVILAYCLNDVNDLLPEGVALRRIDVPRPGWIDPWTSFLFDFLWFRVRLTNDPRVEGYFDWVAAAYEDDDVWARQCERFADIARTCAERGARLDVVVFPFFDSWGAAYPFHHAHDRVAAAWRDLGVRVVDLRATYEGLSPDELVTGRYDAHPGPYAHELAARTILNELFSR